MRRLVALVTLACVLCIYYTVHFSLVSSSAQRQEQSQPPNDGDAVPAVKFVPHALSAQQQSLGINEGLSVERLDLAARLCALPVDDKEDKSVSRMILWTTPVAESARRTLYTDFPLYEMQQNITDESHDHDPPKSHDGTVCLTYTDLPRIVHPSPPELKPEEIIFGVASTKDRLLVPNAVTSHWLRNSSTNFYLHVPKNDAGDAEDKFKDWYRDFGLASYSAGRDSHDIDQTLQYARLSATMYELSVHQELNHIKWFVHLDDDTLLTSIRDYARMLDGYDASRPVYIGANSESASTMMRDGRGAWGGASIAVSRALASQLSARWLECTSEGRMDHSPYGDHKLDACVAHLQGRTRMQPDMKIENSLHQLDFFGSIDGFLRSGIKWLTMHHFGWVNLFPYPDGPGGTPAKLQKIVNSAKVLGSDGLFSNYLLRYDQHGATVLTNGYAVTQYLIPMTRNELETVEKTYMENVPNDYEGAVGPTRPPKREGDEKKTYFVESVVPRIIEGITVGSTWTYRNHHESKIEDLIVDWLL